MDEEKETTKALTQFLQEQSITITEEIAHIYRLHALENRYVLHPRKLDEIAMDDVEQIISFFDSCDEAIALRHGQSRAKIGLNHRALLKTGAYLRSCCFHYARNTSARDMYTLLDVTEKFLNSSISGYIENLKRILLEDQERIARALVKAQQSSQTRQSRQT
jgi:hypothetical protein